MEAAPNQVIDLAVLPPADRAVVAINSAAAEQHLRALVEKSAEIKNVVDKNGRDEAHRAAMGLKNARVAVVNTGKAAREDATAFQRAVVAEVERLAAITADEEARLFGLRDAFDERVAAEKAERERLAAERAASIAAAMQSIRDLPARHAGADSVALGEVLADLALREAAEAEFGDRVAEAKALIDSTAASLIALRGAAVAREEQAEADRKEVERLRVESAEAKRKADEAEAQRLREEQERREELERSTRAQAEAMAAERLQRERMDAIISVQSLGLTVSDARGIDTALAAAVAFDPSNFGEMQPMADAAKTLAVSSLGQRLARVLELEMPGVIDEARAMDAEITAERNEALMKHLVPVHEIDWDEPAPLAPAKAGKSILEAVPAPAPAPDASLALCDFRRALTILRGLRPDAEIRKIFEEEMAVMVGRY